MLRPELRLAAADAGSKPFAGQFISIFLRQRF
jgi:hypothetical protein